MFINDIFCWFIIFINLAKIIILNGHNGPDEGLINCGPKCADTYLSSSKGILDAFINGISKKDFPGIWREVKPLGFTRGIDAFYRNSLVAKLVDNIEEANYWLKRFNFDEVNRDLFIPSIINNYGETDW